MTTNWLFIALQISIIACAIVSGVFLTFSDFVMRSLAMSKTPASIEVMQNINRQVFKYVFMVLLLGMSALSSFLGGYAYLYTQGTPAPWIMAGGIIYFLGVFVVSLIFNVPMNSRLDKTGFSNPEAASYRKNVDLLRWTFWNSIRSIAAAISAICFLFATTAMVQYT